MAVERRRRIAAYGVCRDGDGRVLLVRLTGALRGTDVWLLPGGGVQHGEDPYDAVVREFEEETGLGVRVDRLRDVVSDVQLLPDGTTLRHHDRLIFDVTMVGGELRNEPRGSTDRVAWVAPDELADLVLLPFAAPQVGATTMVTSLTPSPADDETLARLISESAPVVPVAPPTRHQRFAAYGLVTDPADRVLLAMISPGYPGAGRWHLPGGGTDFGESAADGLVREIVEETGQRAKVVDLLSVSHRYQAVAYGPEGVPMDWHGVRVVFRAEVEAPTVPQVTDPGGSTIAAEWFVPADALALPLTEVALETIRRYHAE